MAPNPDLLSLISNTANTMGVDPKYALALAKIESNYNPTATSKVGAKGLFQMMDATAKEQGVKNPYDPAESARGGIGYYKKMLDQFKDPVLAAAAYNAGPGAVRKYGGVPPYAETQNYVKKFSQQLNQSMDPSAVSQIAGAIQNTPGQQPPDLLTMLASLSGQGAPQQTNLDPAMFMRKPQGGGAMDGFTKAMAAIATLGGTAGNLISGFKGNGPVGQGAVESGLSLLQTLQQSKAKQQQQEMINSFLGNEAIPQNARAAMGLAQMGVPDNIASQILGTGKNSSLDQFKEILGTARAAQDYQANTPEGKQAKAQEVIDQKIAEQKALSPLKFADYQKELQAKIQAEAPQLLNKNTIELRKEFTNLPAVKNTGEILRTAGQVEDLWNSYQKNPGKSRATLDQVLITNLNKATDPGSVVREGEYARTEEGISLLNKLSSYSDKLRKGGVAITDADRKDIVDTMRALRDGQLAVFNSNKKFYGDEALRNNIPPERVTGLFDSILNEGTPKNEQPSSAPKMGDVVRGFRFLGGNPGDQKNWEKAS